MEGMAVNCCFGRRSVEYQTLLVGGDECRGNFLSGGNPVDIEWLRLVRYQRNERNVQLEVAHDAASTGSRSLSASVVAVCTLIEDLIGADPVSTHSTGDRPLSNVRKPARKGRERSPWQLRN